MEEKDELRSSFLRGSADQGWAITFHTELVKLYERVTKLEEQHRQHSSKEARAFKIKLLLLGVIPAVVSSIIVYFITIYVLR